MADLETVHIIVRTTTALGAISLTATLASIAHDTYVKRVPLHFHRLMVALLLILDLVDCIPMIFAGFFLQDPTGLGCRLQAAGMLTLEIAIMMWNSFMAWQLHRLIYHRVNPSRLKAAVLPTFAGVLVLTVAHVVIWYSLYDNLFGPANLWCWVSQSYARLGTTYIWWAVSFVWILFVIVRVLLLPLNLRHGHTHRRQRSSSTTPTTTATTNPYYFLARLHQPNNKPPHPPPPTTHTHHHTPHHSLQLSPSSVSSASTFSSTSSCASVRLRIGRQLVVYLVCYCLAWVVPFANRMVQLRDGGKTVPALMIVHALTKPSMGIWDSLAYALTSCSRSTKRSTTSSRHARADMPGVSNDDVSGIGVSATHVRFVEEDMSIPMVRVVSPPPRADDEPLPV